MARVKEIMEFSSKNLWGYRPKSIDIHFDVNETMLAFTSQASARGYISEERTLQDILAKKIVGVWETGTKEMTYAKYYESKYSRNELREKRAEELSQLFSKMKVINHPDLEKYSKIYNLALEKLKIIKNENLSVFPSVFRLLDELQKNNLQFTFLVRTFGAEGPLAVEDVSKKYPNISFKPFIDQRGKTDKLPIHTLHAGDHVAVRDDYKPWGESGKKREHGKPFPVFDSPDEMSVFFDDGIKIDGDCEINNIVNPYDPETGLPIPVSTLIDRSLFRVDTLEAILNDEYYVELFEKALAVKLQELVVNAK